ncbi:MAG: DNA polymerase III subunit beta [Bacteroidetes bacterium]|nr:DNA polymerase III subunit beta [Bacteroidota bacterium]
MKFIVSSLTLMKHLQHIGGVLNSSNSLPILDNFLFEIEKGEMTVSASDLETTMTTKIAIKSEESGNIAVPAKMLMDMLKKLPETPLSFLIDEKTHSIEISAGEGKYRLTGFDGNEFPKVPAITKPSTIKLHSHVIANAINKTIFAAGNDDLRPTMSGVFCQLSDQNILFVATDAHKLVRYTRNDYKATKATASFILPKKPLNLIKGILAAEDTEVTMVYNNTNASFSFNDINLVCRLIDGKYPNYEAVIPKSNPNKLTIDRVSLLNSIGRVALFANKSTNQVRLKITGSELSISAEDYDYNNAANDRLTCSFTGDDMEIGFNSKFLLEMLSNLESDNVIIEMSAPNRAGILLPAEKDNKDEDILMLVMPVMLNS